MSSNEYFLKIAEHCNFNIDCANEVVSDKKKLKKVLGSYFILVALHILSRSSCFSDVCKLLALTIVFYCTILIPNVNKCFFISLDEIM